MLLSSQEKLDEGAQRFFATTLFSLMEMMIFLPLQLRLDNQQSSLIANAP
jgi:hypothetical protein